MGANQYYFLGKITKKYSFKGELIIFLDTDEPSLYYSLKKVFLEIENSFIPFFISEISNYKTNSIRVKFEDINNEKKADELINKKVYLPMSSLPKLKGKKFYYHEIIGYLVQDTKYGKIGSIDYVNNQSSHHLFVLKKDNKEILIPINEDFIIEVNRNKKIIKMDLPEGLINLYI